VTRYLAALAVVVAGVCTTAMNWRFSYQLGTSTWDGYTWATFSVALDVAKWLMLPLAAVAWPRHRPRAMAAFAIWLMATIYSFAAAIGFAALNRDATAAERQSQIELHDTISTMKSSPRWQSTAACADATTKASQEFCARYRATEAKLKTAPQEANPQAALISRLTGYPQATVNMVIAVFLATACEIISALGLYAVLPPNDRSQPPRPPRAWQPPKWKNASPRQPAPGRDTPRPAAPGRDWTRPVTQWKSPR
jgi:hypothetical protein